MKRLETERLIIRKFEEKDVTSLHELFCDDESMRWVALYPAFIAMEETKERMKEWIEDDEHYALVEKIPTIF
ncbi:MAG: GNAT family N-acetyltransferase [Candidatus Izemoplasmatales bacterium]|nr:GNAT family N-acetyltransferase [Candidatus Izemoplasmatales bacterium]